MRDMPKKNISVCDFAESDARSPGGVVDRTPQNGTPGSVHLLAGDIGNLGGRFDDGTPR